MPSLDFEKEKKRFRDYYNDDIDILKDAASSFATLILLLLTDNDEFDTPNVIFRVKDREECIKKFERKYLKKLEDAKEEYEIKDHITDIIGVRIVCYYETDIDHIKTILLSNFTLIDETDKAHAIEEKDDVFGYKALHLDLRLNSDRLSLPEYDRFKNVRFEVQIRTIVQDAWSVLDHKIKYKRNIPHDLKRRINRMAALFELADQEFVHIKHETIRFEEKAKEKGSDETEASGISDELNAFNFLKLVNEYFPGFKFYGYKVDGFVDELKNTNPQITVDQLKEAYDDNKKQIEEYKRYQYEKFYNTLNPYTELRHALYLKDKDLYSALLFDLQRDNLEKWLTNSSI